jgi:hypothetical protein
LTILGAQISPKLPWNEKGRDNSIQLGIERKRQAHSTWNEKGRDNSIQLGMEWKKKKKNFSVKLVFGRRGTAARRASRAARAARATRKISRPYRAKDKGGRGHRLWDPGATILENKIKFEPPDSHVAPNVAPG